MANLIENIRTKLDQLGLDPSQYIEDKFEEYYGRSDQINLGPSRQVQLQRIQTYILYNPRAYLPEYIDRSFLEFLNSSLSDAIRINNLRELPRPRAHPGVPQIIRNTATRPSVAPVATRRNLSSDATRAVATRPNLLSGVTRAETPMIETNKHLEVGPQCVICQEDFSEQYGTIAVLKCQHIFHKNCLTNIRRNGQNELVCPICRTTFTFSKKRSKKISNKKRSNKKSKKFQKSLL